MYNGNLFLEYVYVKANKTDFPKYLIKYILNMVFLHHYQENHI